MTKHRFRSTCPECKRRFPNQAASRKNSALIEVYAKMQIISAYLTDPSMFTEKFRALEHCNEIFDILNKEIDD